MLISTWRTRRARGLARSPFQDFPSVSTVLFSGYNESSRRRLQIAVITAMIVVTIAVIEMIGVAAAAVWGVANL